MKPSDMTIDDKVSSFICTIGNSKNRLLPNDINMTRNYGEDHKVYKDSHIGEKGLAKDVQAKLEAQYISSSSPTRNSGTIHLRLDVQVTYGVRFR